MIMSCCKRGFGVFTRCSFGIFHSANHVSVNNLNVIVVVFALYVICLIIEHRLSKT